MSKKFLVYIVILFFVMSLLTYIAQQYNVLSSLFHAKGHVLNLFFFILSLNVHFIGVFLQKKYPSQFPLLYMLIITVRMLGTLSFYLVLWKMKLVKDMSLNINFLLLYFSYTVFEISSLLATLRPNLKR